MDEEESSFIICNRVADQPDPISGVTQSNCSECDALIWVAPTSLQVMSDENAQPICFPCAIAREPDLINKINPPNKDQIIEVIKELRKRKKQK